MDRDTKRTILALGLTSLTSGHCSDSQNEFDDETLMAFIDKSLTAREFNAVKHHIASCDYCYNKLSEISRSLIYLQLPKISPKQFALKSNTAGFLRKLLSDLSSNWLSFNNIVAGGLVTGLCLVIAFNIYPRSLRDSLENEISVFAGSSYTWLQSESYLTNSRSEITFISASDQHNIIVGVRSGLELADITATKQLPNEFRACSEGVPDNLCKLVQNQAFEFGLWEVLAGFRCQQSDFQSIENHRLLLVKFDNSSIHSLIEEFELTSGSDFCTDAQALFHSLMLSD